MGTPGMIRRLGRAERNLVRDHLLRLSPDQRQLRYGGALSDARLELYSDDLDWSRAAVIGCLVDSQVRALGELKPLGGLWPEAAEVALSVEKPFQNRGIGTELLRRLITLARNRLIRSLAMVCLPENGRVLHLARKLGASLAFEQGEVNARLALPWPNHLTLLLEMIDEAEAVLGIASAGPAGLYVGPQAQSGATLADDRGVSLPGCVTVNRHVGR